LNALELPGVQFIPTHFQPMFDKHSGKGCGGALLRVTDRSAFRSFETGMRVIEVARRLAPARFRWRTVPYEFDPRPGIDLLTGSPRFRETVERGAGLSDEIARHDLGALDFLARREWYLLYPDRRPAVVAFVGAHNSGKTTVLVDLVPRLVAMGLTVGTQAHLARHRGDVREGLSSPRALGGAASVLVTPGRDRPPGGSGRALGPGLARAGRLRPVLVKASSDGRSQIEVDFARLPPCRWKAWLCISEGLSDSIDPPSKTGNDPGAGCSWRDWMIRKT
jgi:hypothetical protein